MTNIEKAKEMLENNPELMEKVNAEVERLANAKEAATPEEAMAKAIKTVLDIDVPEEELKESRKMNLDELDDVAGGEYPDGHFQTCWFGCKGPEFNTRNINGHHYAAWRCSKCGHEYFKMDGRSISPTAFYKAVIMYAAEDNNMLGVTSNFEGE